MILPGNDTHTLPTIIFEEIKGTLSVKGRSISPNAEEYFADFLEYFNECITKNPMNLTIDMDLEYFSTRSARALIKMFDVARKVKDKGFIVIVNWYYEEGDESMKESGEDYAYVSKLKNFNLIEKPE
jgi:SiaC family regulatory phosphoprotein